MISFRLTCLIAALTFSVQSVAAPTIPPSAIDAFNSASPEQQRKLAGQYGASIGDVQAAISSQRIQGNATEENPEDLGAPGSALEQAIPVKAEAPLKNEPELIDVQTPEKQAIATLLPRFGSGIFDKDVTTFAPVDNIPVPQGYLLGVGDNLTIVLYGNDNIQTELTINREGSINFPLLGPIVLAGMPWVEARGDIEARVSEQLIGTKVVPSLGRLRSINVFMAGEVAVPGNYSVSALTTIIQSIYVAGGITAIGSYRDIQVKRAGKTVATMDLYDLLLRGSLADDLRLQTGDVVFVPAALPRVGIQGEVLRSAQFEVQAGETLADMLAMAGGPTSQAYLEAAVLQRRNPAMALPELLNLNLRSSGDLQQTPLDGDLLTVAKLSDRIENPIFLRGAIERPGLYAWTAGDRLSTFIRGTDGYLKPEADRDIGIIVRRLNDRLDIKVLPFSPLMILENPRSEEDLLLVANDEIYIFNRLEAYANLLAPVVSRLELQATQSDWPQVVTISGAVAGAGKYPLGGAETVADLLRISGGEEGFNLNVDLKIGLIVRRKDSLYKVEAIPFNLGDALKDPESDSNRTLEPLDEVLIFNQVASDNSNRLGLMASLVQKFKRQATVNEAPQVMTVDGRVRLPGEYPILAVDNLAFLIDLAGGFSEGAYTKKAEILRVSTNSDQERETKIIQVAIDTDAALALLRLKSRDSLRVNTVPGWSEQNVIELSGEVLFPGVYNYEKGEMLGAVLARAGGLTDDAFAVGAVYTNRQAAINQRQQAQGYIEKLRQEQFSKNLTDAADDADDADELNSNFAEYVDSSISGRVSINLSAIVAGEQNSDVTLQNGDTLFVPQVTNYVGVVGDVFSPGNFKFEPKLRSSAVIELAGGVTRYGDRKRAYILKADGRVVSLSANAWFSGGEARDKLAAGDVIVVPNNSDYVKPLEKWQTVTNVVFQSFASIAAFFSIADR